MAFTLGLGVGMVIGVAVGAYVAWKYLGLHPDHMAEHESHRGTSD
jgi:hypothetical protein